MWKQVSQSAESASPAPPRTVAIPVSENRVRPVEMVLENPTAGIPFPLRHLQPDKKSEGLF